MGYGFKSDRFDFCAAGRGLLRWLVVVVLIATATLLAPERASAQVLYGSIVGNVTDANGAVVPGAAVTATDQGTGVSKTTNTDQTGTYQFVDLQAGTYTLKVAVSGFKTFERRDLPVIT